MRDSTQVLDGLVALVERSRAFAIRDFENQDQQQLRQTLLPQTDELLHDAEALFVDVLDTYDDHPLAGSTLDPDSKDAESFFVAVDSIVSSNPASRIADLAFMARLEICSRRERLAHLGADCPAWGLVAACTSARRRVVKAASALVFALRELAGIPSNVDDGFVTELATSLSIRRAYTGFRRAVAEQDRQVGTTEVFRRLRLAGIQLAMLVSTPIYEELRVIDRREFRRLQAAILGWLRTPERDARRGEHIWKDLATFSEMLVQVNRRGDLQQHDRAVAEELLPLLHDGSETAWARAKGLAGALFGRDDRLDELAERSDPNERDMWASVVQGVLDALDQEHAEAAPRQVLGDITALIMRLSIEDGVR